jgi:hypothetical protein
MRRSMNGKRAGSRGQIARQALAATLVLALAGAPLAQTGPDPQERAAAAAALLKGYAARYEKQDHSASDVRALAAKLGGDPAVALAWVREHIRSESYRGSLRGAQGVLVSSAGNSLDQALLLAALLAGSGRELRIAQGAGPENPSENAGPAPAKDEPLAPETLLQDLRRLAAEQGLAPAQIEPMLQGVQAGMERQAALLRSAAAGAASDYDAVISKLDLPALEQAPSAEPAAPHFWLQARVADQWQDLDPAGQPGAPAATYAPAALPDELVHTLTFRLILEQSSAGHLSRRSLVERIRKTSELTGMRVGVALLPADIDLQRLADPALSRAERMRILAGTRSFKPTLSFGQEAIEGEPFNLQGNKAVAAGTGASAGAVSALEAIGGLGEPGPGAPGSAAQQALTAVVLEVEWHSPGRPVRMVRREILDRIGPAGRKAGRTEPAEAWRSEERVAWRLLSTYELLAVPGPLSSQVASEMVGRFLVEHRPLLEQLLQQPQSASLQDVPSAPLGLVELMALRTALLDGQAGAAPGAGLRYDQANLWCREQLVDLAGGSEPVVLGGIDILWNGLAPAALDPKAREARIRQGLLDTHLEQQFLAASSGEPGALGVPEIFRRARGSGRSIVAVRSAEDLARLTLPPDAAARIGEELVAGYMVVVPDGTVEDRGVPRIGWWRVDPRSGETLGMLDSGTGGVYAETLTVLFYVVFNITCLLQSHSAGGILICWGLNLFGAAGILVMTGTGVTAATIAYVVTGALGILQSYLG